MKKTFLKNASRLLMLTALSTITLFTSCEKEGLETFDQQEIISKQTRDTYLNLPHDQINSKSLVPVGLAGKVF